MSLDYPNRADWLAVRYTAPKYTGIVRVIRSDRVRSVYGKGTHSIGMRKIKADKYEAKQARRRAFRLAKRGPSILGLPQS